MLRSEHESCDTNRAHIESDLARCTHSGIERFEDPYLVHIGFASGSNLHVHLATLSAHYNQSQHPFIIARVRREEIIDHSGAKERFGLGRRPCLKILLKQFA
ncbi:hypothetical protein LJR022_010099 [Paraburkholderia hospita]|uniref:hypothetical protein n=1 Tax=Paraburkholderia hospita TaxID=169430 RepID=UPI003ED0360F